MASIKNTAITNFIFIISKLGANKLALACVDKILAETVSLNQIRKLVSAAKSKSQAELIQKYASKAISLYPANSFGYIQQAELFIQLRKFDQAKAILKQAPQSRTTQELASKLRKLQASGAKIAQPIKQTSPLERAYESAGNDETLLTAIREKALSELSRNPNNESIYKILFKVLNSLRLHHEVINTLSLMPSGLASKPTYQLMLATAQQSVGQHSAAYQTLLNAQIEAPADRTILMRISSILRDDAKPQLAYSYIRAARACYPQYGAVRQLTFEIDQNLLAAANKTFQHVLDYPPIDFLKFLPMINRATPFFSEERAKLQHARMQARQLVEAEKGRKGINPSEQLRVAVKARWMDTATRIIHRAAKGTQPISANRLSWFETVSENTRQNSILFDLAGINEDSDILYAVVDGKVTAVEHIESGLDIIEIFLPTVFYADPEEEKPSYSTVRRLLTNVYSYMLTKPGLALIPRHQWNWRHCDPRAENAKTISYHTNGSYNPKHLHIQELSLAGRCSFDTQGFAGYSSIAQNYKTIDEFRFTQPLEKALHVFNETANQYITNNISKYDQTHERADFEYEYVFVALQIPTDTVASLAFVDGLTLVETIANHYTKTSTKVIVKRHPYCNSKSVESTLKRLASQSKIILSNASVHDLISNAKTVYTVNSGVGLEALLHKKPVVVTGHCDYAYAVSTQAKSLQELKASLAADQSFDLQRAAEFINYFISKYSSPADDVLSIQDRIDEWLSYPSVDAH